MPPPRRFAPRGRKALAAYFTVGLAVFVLFLVASFPYNATVSSMLAPYHLRLTYDRQRISLPIGARLFNVSLLPALPAQGDALLHSPEVTLAPTLSALLLGRPGLRITAQLYDGTAHVALRQRPHDTTDIAFQVDAINPARCAPLAALGAIVEGQVSAAGTARIVSPSVPDNSAQMTLRGQGLVLTLVNGIGFPPVTLGNISGTLRLDQGTVALDQIHAADGDADIDGSGTIQLGQTLADSTIELHFTLIPTPAGRDHLGFFLQALPRHEDSSTPYILSGPLLAPRLS
jgi:type II secretion system protein N